VASETSGSSGPSLPGIFRANTSGRLAILNGSIQSVADDCSEHTVLVLPDYKFVVGVPPSLDGAAQLWADALDPAFGRLGSEQSVFKSWILPYSCVILLCEVSPGSCIYALSEVHALTGSHKQRDKRCSIAAPKLEIGK
jgi:hypothetical protein